MPGRGSADVSIHRLCGKWLLEFSGGTWLRRVQGEENGYCMLLLDGLRLGTGIVGSGPLSCALFSGTSEP